MEEVVVVRRLEGRQYTPVTVTPESEAPALCAGCAVQGVQIAIVAHGQHARPIGDDSRPDPTTGLEAPPDLARPGVDRRNRPVVVAHAEQAIGKGRGRPNLPGKLERPEHRTTLDRIPMGESPPRGRIPDEHHGDHRSHAFPVHHPSLSCRTRRPHHSVRLDIHPVWHYGRARPGFPLSGTASRLSAHGRHP